MIYKDFQGLKLSQLGFGTMRLPLREDKTIDLEQAAASPAGQDFAALLRTTIEALERASAALRKHCGA